MPGWEIGRTTSSSSTFCVVRTGESVRFERCDVDQVMATLVLRLPEISVGQGDPISVGHDDFHAPRSRTPGNVLRRAAARPDRARPDGARRLDALLDAQRLHVTKLYAAKRDDRGVRSRSDWWITVLDLVEGRWALSVAQRRHEKWIDAAPGTPQLIAEKLVALARSVR
jgi:hypothetical protein